MNEEKFPPGIIIYFDRLLPFAESELFSDEAFGKTMKALVKLGATGEMPSLDGQARLAFDVIRPDWERGVNAYRAKCIENSNHAKYMAYCRNLKDGETKLSQAEFLDRLAAGESIGSQEDENHKPQPSDEELRAMQKEQQLKRGIWP